MEWPIYTLPRSTPSHRSSTPPSERTMRGSTTSQPRLNNSLDICRVFAFELLHSFRAFRADTATPRRGAAHRVALRAQTSCRTRGTTKLIEAHRPPNTFYLPQTAMADQLCAPAARRCRAPLPPGPCNNFGSPMMGLLPITSPSSSARSAWRAPPPSHGLTSSGAPRSPCTTSSLRRWPR